MIFSMARSTKSDTFPAARSASSSATRRFSRTKFAASRSPARQLFVNISDDGWFGGSGAPEQHLAMARVRAVENRRWLLRDTNDGITVSVDPYGRIVARLPANIRGELDAPYAFRSDLTHMRAGATGSRGCACLAALVLVLVVARDRRAKFPDRAGHHETPL